MSGDRNSGLKVKGNSWTMGAEVRLFCDPEADGAETIEVYLTMGSEGTGRMLLYRGSEPETVGKIKMSLSLQSGGR